MAIDINLDYDGLADSGAIAATGQHVSAADALVRSIRDKGRVDMPYIARLAGLTEADAEDALDGSVFLDPDSGDWQTSGVYLSGDLGRKLEAAREACGWNTFFERNVSALEAAMPPKIPASEIYAALGSPWMPEQTVLDFIHHIIPASSRIELEILHDRNTGSWNVRGKGPMKLWPGSVEVWGTKRVPALDILEDSLNGRDVRVYDEVPCPSNRSGKKRVLNHGDTMEALEKQRRMAGEFGKWVWSEPWREGYLEQVFNRHYGTFAMQRFDGSCLEFPGMSPDVELRPYQRDAVMRMLLKKNVLLAHDVGAGKTYTCIAAGMELKRIDPAERVLYVVPNNVVGQWADLFSQMYHQADVLVIPKSPGPERLQAVLADIRDGGHDAVVMAQSCFDRIPVSKRFRLGELSARMAELDAAKADPARATTAVKVERAALAKRYDKVSSEVDCYDGICFDELGITRLFVDEAHNYKNLAHGGDAETRGFGPGGSRKCDHMLDAVRCTTRAGGGVVFATGTVLTNSIADCYTFQRYLQPNMLAVHDLADFDAWCGMFAQKRTAWEIDVDTAAYRLSTRFAGFGNLDVLSSVLGYVADFHHMAPGEDLPRCDGREDVPITQTGELSAYLQEISARADRVRHGRVRPSEDNLLKICTDGRKAALEIRLVNDKAKPGWDCKVGACAATVARIWHETERERLTQLVFCDTSTPREGFNVYDELKQALVVLGVEEEEIAFVHDAGDSEFARSRLFAAVRAGKVRVLVGSTAKLGIGVNVQDRLVAAHHLDVPWRPADMTQREGRILRFGNMNQKVEIYRYVTEGSFDAYSWQLLERKQRAIDELLSGTYEGGWMESDVGDSALSYGEIKALAVGNPMLRERVKVANELERARILQRKGASARARLAEKVSDIVGAVERVEAELAACTADAEFAADIPDLDLGMDERTELGARILQLADCFALDDKDWEIGSYRGFTLFVPAGMQSEHPSLLLVREGRWPVDLGEGKERGVVTRLENAIRGLSKHRAELENRREILYGNWDQAERELAEAGGGIAAEIEQLKARLSEIDLKLEEDALAMEADEDEQ